MANSNTIPTNSIISGGYSNTIGHNTAIGYSSWIGGGNRFCGNPDAATRIVIMEKYQPHRYFIGGGCNNTASGSYSIILGGINNIATGSYGFIGGGNNNTATENIYFAGTKRPIEYVSVFEK
jgi:hypothetical protein